MGKKKIKIFFRSLLFLSFLLIINGIYIIYSHNKEIKENVYEVNNVIEYEQVILLNNETEETKDDSSIEELPQLGENALGIIMFSSGKSAAIYNSPTEYHMKIGVGKLNNNSLLNESGNNIILGHRDSVFSELEHLIIGDIIKIKTITKTKEYKVFEMYSTTKEDPIPYQNSDENIITLITCYPFGYIGRAPKRYIVKAISIN